MECGIEGRDLLHQIVDQALARDHRESGNVVDRLLRIKLGALPADHGQNVDHMRLDIEQAEFEHGEEPDGARADDHGIRSRSAQCHACAHSPDI